MSSILYYSNFCEPSKKLLQTVSKTQMAKDIHFICIDNRVKDSNGKIFIVLQNGQKIIMPENVTKVPALLLLNQNYKVVYGDDIYKHLKPQVQQQVKEATKNNMEPVNFQDGFGSFSGFGGGIVSDNYSFLDNTLEHCEYLILATVDTKDDCFGEHISHYTIDIFEEKGYDVKWKAKLQEIQMPDGIYNYIIFCLFHFYLV